MYIERHLQKQIRQGLDENLAVILYGARQTGKTTLAQHIASQYEDNLYLNCDNPDVVTNLTNKTDTELKALIGDARMVVIDEAQRVENIGLSAKLIHDTYPEVKLLLTGSSSLDLANKVKEPLTGRSLELLLFPLAITEVATTPLEMNRLLEKSLVYGSYPGIWQLGYEAAAQRLKLIANQYLYRDAFSPKTVYDQVVLDSLLRLLAFQVGNEVSYNELANHLGVSRETVMRYVDLLEKAFIIFRLNQFKRNQRTEVGRLRKVYFYDLGIRNGIIDNFKPLELRDDIGALWENYCVVERMKFLQAEERFVRPYYWRSPARQEVDLIEEESTELRAFECKYKPAKLAVPSQYAARYPASSFSIVHKENIFTDFIKPIPADG